MKTAKVLQQKHLIATLALCSLMIGCTEERSFDSVYKDDLNLIEKTQFNANDEYLYLPSTVETSRTTSATRPHWMGDAKRVKLVVTETELKVVEIDKEEKLNDNPANNLPVLSIPIVHIDYKCSEDADGKCTQKEEENKDISWTNKRYIQLKSEEMKIQEVNVLPEQISNLFMKCYEPTSESLIDAKIEPDAINISFERSYQTDIKCAENISGLEDLGFRVRYHYSIVKLSRLTTAGYKPIEYSREEENKFGFFNTNSNKLDVDNNETLDGEKTFVNRWAPNKAVRYHLSESFLKSENKNLFSATKHAVNSINDSLKIAGAQMQIDLVDPVVGLQTGDLRVNSIVLVDDPLAMSVIGYGPTAANPKTGEIVHGRTVMYLGTIQKYIKNSYEEFVKAKKEQAGSKKQASDMLKSQAATVSEELQVATDQSLASQASLDAESILETIHGGEHNHQTNKKHSNTFKGSARFSVNDKMIKDRVMNPLNQKVSARDLFLQNANDSKAVSKLKKEFIYSKNCFYTADMIEFNSAIEDEIDKLIQQLGLKTWEQLSSEDKQLVLNTMTPFVWVPVLVHELGHNLGLRHNFAGSEDEDNYYTKKELADMGISRPIKYSSVMDYTYNSLNELPVMGKYDIAALKYAYAEKVDVVANAEKKTYKTVSLEEYRKAGATLKNYDYCTDEHVSVNPNCNRFDEGSTLTEIAQHHIKAYEEAYLKNNFRNNRRSFSLMDDDSYMSRLDRTIGSLRTIFERYESVKNDFGLDEDNAIWDTNEFLKDLKSATVLAAKFYIKVLQTPDLMCAVSAKANPSQIVAVVPINDISTSAVDCFDTENVQLNDQYMIVGKAGKLFQSKKDRRMSNPYIDQIDVRGVWIDKLMALEALVGRKVGISTFDKYQENFLDIKPVAEEVENALRALLMDQTVTEIEIEIANGQKLKTNFPVKMYNKLEAKNGHRIIDPLNTDVSKALNLPLDHPTFQKVVIKNLMTHLPSQAQVTDPTSLLNSIIVGKARLTDNIPNQGVVSTNIGQLVYYAPVSNAVAAAQIQLKNTTTVLETLGEEKVKEIAKKKADKVKLDEKATEAEKMAYSMPEEILKAFIEGQFQAKEFYEMTLLSM